MLDIELPNVYFQIQQNVQSFIYSYHYIDMKSRWQEPNIRHVLWLQSTTRDISLTAPWSLGRVLL